MMFLWYAYQLDIIGNGGTPSKIAVGCVAANGGRPCYFDDLLDYVQRASQKWPGSSGVGQNLKPDVVSTATTLTGKGYAPDWDNNLLFGRGANVPQTLARQWEEIVDRVQEIRRAPPPGVDISDLVDNLKLAVQGAHEMRIIDQATGLLATLKAYLGYEPEQKTTRKALDGTAIVELDEPATQALHSDFSAKFPGLWAWLDNMKKTNPQRYKLQPFKNTVLHNNALQSMQGFETRLNAGCA
jgi:hypothetical protein